MLWKYDLKKNLIWLVVYEEEKKKKKETDKRK